MWKVEWKLHLIFFLDMYVHASLESTLYVYTFYTVQKVFIGSS